MKTMLNKSSLIILIALAAYSSPGFALSSGIPIEGILLKPDSSPVVGAVLFKLQIRAPDSNNCLMYEEQQNVVMTPNGGFSLTLNDGSGSRTDLTGLPFDRVFSNAQGTINVLSFNPATCVTGSTYTAGPNDGRNLVVLFKDLNMPAFEPIPQQTISFVPYAIEAKQIAGFTPASLVRVAETDGTLGSVSPLSAANYTELVALIGGSSAQYAKTSGTAGTVVASYSGAPASPTNGSFWYDTSSSTLKYRANNTTSTLAGGGTVTSVATGTGLAGGPITGTGTLSLATLGVGGTGFKVTYDTYGRVTGAVALVEADIPTLSSAGKVVGSAITSGTIGGSTSISTTGTISSGAITASSLSIPSGGGNVGIGTTSPSTKLEVVGTLKVGDGGEPCGGSFAGGVRYNTGNIQFCNGTAWTTLGVAGAGFTALTGDVTASGTGSVAATVANVGGVTAANVAAGANAATAATNLSTASTIVKRDASSNFAAAAITHTASVFKDTGANTVTVSAPTTVTTNYSLKLPAAVPGTAGQVLASDTSGNTSWASIPVALPPNGAAGGDLAGTYPNPNVATVGSVTAANVALGANAANAATNLNTPSTIIKRDASGSFTAYGITSTTTKADTLSLNNAGSVLNITNPIGGAWNMTLPATAGTSGQVLSTNGSGLLSWVAALTASTGFINGGNSFGANASVGTNDAFRLDVKTNNLVRATVDSAGNVGIGTTAPAAALDIAGHIGDSGTALAAAAVSSCGVSAAITGNDTRGMVTIGGTPTACTITFSSTFATPPHCVISPSGGFAGSGLQWYVLSSTTSLTMNFNLAPTANQKFEYICIQ